MTLSIVKQNEIIEKMDRNRFYETILNRIELLATEKHQVWINTEFTKDILNEIKRDYFSDFDKLQEINLIVIKELSNVGGLGEFAQEVSKLVDLSEASCCRWCSDPFLSIDIPKIKRLDTDLLYHGHCYNEMKARSIEKNSEGIKE